MIIFYQIIAHLSQLNRIGPKLLFNGGILTTGTCAIFFGLLDKVNGHYPFIILSFVIRIVEAMGNAAFLTASFAIIAKEFPNNVATTFASLETFFGLGLIVGPTVGGALYQVKYFLWHSMYPLISNSNVSTSCIHEIMHNRWLQFVSFINLLIIYRY